MPRIADKVSCNASAQLLVLQSCRKRGFLIIEPFNAQITKELRKNSNFSIMHDNTATTNKVKLVVWL